MGARLVRIVVIGAVISLVLGFMRKDRSADREFAKELTTIGKDYASLQSRMDTEVAAAPDESLPKLFDGFSRELKTIRTTLSSVRVPDRLRPLRDAWSNSYQVEEDCMKELLEVMKSGDEKRFSEFEETYAERIGGSLKIIEDELAKLGGNWDSLRLKIAERRKAL